MKTIVINDLAFLGKDYESAKDGILYLKCLQKNGYEVIRLTEKSYQDANFMYLNCQKKNQIEQKQKKSVFPNEGYLKIHFSPTKENYRLESNYTILANGAQIRDHSSIIWQTSSFSEEELLQLRQTLESYSYQEKKKETNEKIIAWDEKTYTLLHLNDHDNQEVFAIQCSKKNLIYDFHLIQDIENNHRFAKGYLLNKQPVFFSRNINEKTAIEELKRRGMIDLTSTYFILCNYPDQVLYNEYENENCFVLGNRVSCSIDQKENSLIRVLEKIDAKKS